jgi:hypothetical protein
MKTIRMPKDLADKWLSALRSGEYKQGKGQLCTYDNIDGSPRYCCLGVLEHVVDGKVEEYGDTMDSSLSHPSIGWLYTNDIVFKDEYPMMNPWLPSLNTSAANANDSGKYTFNQIADAIELALETF